MGRRFYFILFFFFLRGFHFDICTNIYWPLYFKVLSDVLFTCKKCFGQWNLFGPFLWYQPWQV
jgi:hypothetical protein